VWRWVGGTGFFWAWPIAPEGDVAGLGVAEGARAFPPYGSLNKKSFLVLFFKKGLLA
jgi:hypothetical protein